MCEFCEDYEYLISVAKNMLLSFLNIDSSELFRLLDYYEK